tara:strand:- start:1304 stop:1834 length:531 start_codon:yes stop_codon:yes gene_type:complete
MKVVDKFGSLTEHLISDPRVAKYGMLIVKHGFKGAASKVNPVALYIDAALSVIEAANSYLRYAKERERTKQILIENDRIEFELKSQLKILKIEGVTLKLKGEERIEALTLHFKHNALQSKNIIIEVREMLKHAKTMQGLIRKEREDNLSFIQVVDLQKNLDFFIVNCLSFISTSFE